MALREVGISSEVDISTKKQEAVAVELEVLLAEIPVDVVVGILLVIHRHL